MFHRRFVSLVCLYVIRVTDLSVLRHIREISHSKFWVTELFLSVCSKGKQTSSSPSRKAMKPHILSAETNSCVLIFMSENAWWKNIWDDGEIYLLAHQSVTKNVHQTNYVKPRQNPTVTEYLGGHKLDPLAINSTTAVAAEARVNQGQLYE